MSVYIINKRLMCLKKLVNREGERVKERMRVLREEEFF